MSTVTIACTIANGVHLGTDEFGRPVMLSPAQTGSTNPGTVLGLSLTDVDATFWANWLAANANNALVANNAIWQVS